MPAVCGALGSHKFETMTGTRLIGREGPRQGANARYLFDLDATFPDGSDRSPPIAKAARVSGTVVIQATISKSGTIENLKVISGPAMLQQSALDAVRSWRYRPYLLNNDPVEVETTINVIFTLGG